MTNKTPNRLRQAQSLHQAGELNQALGIYEELLSEDPKQPLVLNALAILLGQKRQWRDAQLSIQQALELEPNNALLHNTLGLIYSKQHQTSEAIGCFEKAVILAPSFANAHNHLANQYRKQGNVEAAIKHYEHAIDNDEENVELRLNLALLYMEQQRFATAKQYLQQVLERAPTHSNARHHLGQLYLQISDYDAALKQLTLHCDNAPEDGDALHDLALAELKLNQQQHASEHLQQAISLKTSYCDAHFHLGIALLQQGLYSDALTQFMQQLEIQGSAECSFNIGVLLMYEGRQPEAEEYFQQTLQQDPTHKHSWVNLGVMALKSNQKRKALEAYKQALAIDPADAEIKHIVSALSQDDHGSAQAPESFVKHLFNQYSPYYDGHLTQGLKYQGPQAIYELLTSNTHLQHNRWSIADLGCGTGLMGERLQPFASELIGIDLSECMLELAEQKRIYSKLICADLVAGLQQCQTFDFITAADVFTYIGDLKPILSACFQHLSSEGYLCFTVEANYNCDSYQLLPSIRYGHHPNYLAQRAEQLGFEQIEQHNIVLRTDQNQPIEGLVLLWQRQ